MDEWLLDEGSFMAQRQNGESESDPLGLAVDSRTQSWSVAREAA